VEKKPLKGDSGDEKMERQKTLMDKVVESEAVFDERELAEAEFLRENEEPADIADRLYEEWRDEHARRKKAKD
jgi:hypothetical protein